MQSMGSSSESISTGAAGLSEVACRQGSETGEPLSNRERLGVGVAAAAVQWLSVAKISRAWLMSMCMSSTRAAAGDGRGLAAVAAALETAGQVAGVDAGSQ